ncbi:MAG: recombinase family protein, partial [Planctomycetota bacterium]
SFLLKEDIENVFEDHPSRRTKEDVFEQIINFTFSEKYPLVKGLIEPLFKKAVSFNVTKVV